LDPQRFTRGVPIDGESKALGQVMVRRLKRDLREAEVADTQFPRRKVVKVAIDGAHAELALAEMLAEYTQLMKPQKGRGQLVFINLQKRLLSSVDAFYRTLQAHADRVGTGQATAQVEAVTDQDDEEPSETIDADEDL